MRPTFRLISTISLTLLTLTLAAQQTPTSTEKPVPAADRKSPSPEEGRIGALRHRDTALDPLRIYHLQAGSGPNYSNEVLTGLRVMLDPSCKVYLVPEQNTVLVRCDEDSLKLADSLMREMDTSKPNYRLTFSIAESDNGKRLGLQHVALNVIPGIHTTLKNGSRVPVATGSYSGGGTGALAVQTQFTYLDIGLNFDVTLDQGASGMRLRSRIEQSAGAEEKSFGNVVEPVIRQATLEGSSTLLPGKPLTLGSLDIAGSTRHLDVEVLLEAQK